MKPLLASAIKSETDIKFPVYASPKLDGIRCLIINGKPVSRTLKDIPNLFVQEMLSNIFPSDIVIDGELMLDGRPFNEVSSAIMSVDGTPNFTYNIFDIVIGNDFGMPFEDRLLFLENLHLPKYCQLMSQTLVNNLDELTELEQKFLALGYEGVMLRSTKGVYKQGRSTVKEGTLLKVKRFKDAEAIIVGFEERQHNNNEATIDNLGHTKRSSHKANKAGAGDLGAFEVRREDGVEFNIGTGFTQEQRTSFWLNKDKLLGKLVKYKYFEIGSVEAPRFPTFLGFRHEEDT